MVSPALSPLLAVLPSQSTLATYSASCAFFTSSYFICTRLAGWNVYEIEHSFAPAAARQERKMKMRKRSWIITTLAAAITTAVSLVYVRDWLASGFDVARVHRRAALSDTLTTFFSAYLTTDCVLGMIFYRPCFSLVTGWIHHGAYMALIAYISPLGWSHIFALGSFMELPTCILGASTIWPAVRNDIAFAAVFFATRLLFHGVLIASYATQYGQTHGTHTGIKTLVPALCLSGAVPLHIWWFTASVRGIRRRARQTASTSVSAATTPSAEKDEAKALEVPTPVSVHMSDTKPLRIAQAVKLLRRKSGPILVDITNSLGPRTTQAADSIKQIRRSFAAAAAANTSAFSIRADRPTMQPRSASQDQRRFILPPGRMRTGVANLQRASSGFGRSISTAVF
ncbi:uncharacterized protein L969DRAFT_100910 [Mixia osmundae IAM 14324]|uniref:TLC domain-containing protein n=1 Tax=Mixia osmundae (strain CBS 9802 / IAM 14324 / JCM 22182 / KY 12970) TaxID=764103 RepID=G7E393_MIXOS|nr:uncharacterized protein L969DRAFT_100910 [Mixia osmundae IAM 14324]KEI42437.1 hypothetical protein L969DRAFT_100910 [Mixia osmundae IAM 14324]GAA97274.1 hypothetical protein E5Q_03951 [Mixia osmundae IAM 14324]